MRSDGKICAVILGLLVSVLMPAACTAQGTGGKQQGGGQGGTQGGGSQGGGSQGGGNQKGQGPNTASPSGSNAPFESQMLAYAAADHIAAAIAAKACENLNRKSIAVIYDTASFSSVLAYQSFKEQASALAAAYDKEFIQLVPPPQTAQSTIASLAAVQSVVSLLAQLATSSNTESGSTITMADTTMQLKIAHELVANCKVPEAPPPATATTAVQSVPIGQAQTPPPRPYVPIVITPQFGTALEGEVGTSDETEAEKDILAQIAKIETSKSLVSDALAKQKKPADSPEASDYKELNALFDTFIQNTFGTNATTGVPQFSLIVQGQVLDKLLGKEETIVIFEQVLAAGGTMKTRKNLITSLSVGDLISYSGGAVVAVAILQTRCRSAPCSPLVFSDVFRYRTPFGRIHNPANVAHVRDGENFDDKMP